MNIFKKMAIQKAISEAWNNPDGRQFREKLFPNGKPTPEEFITTIAQYVQEEKNFS